MILVTGACGFLGSHVMEWFHSRGYNVYGIDNLTQYETKLSNYKTDSRMYNHSLLTKKGLAVKVYDLLDENLLSMENPEYIVHCAAQPTMTLAIEDPVYDFENNLRVTLNLLELARKLDVPIALCSSVHVFGNSVNLSLLELEDRFVSRYYDEEDPILDGDITPLHASKAALEIYGRAYIETYGLKVGIFRLSGMYGPRQFAGMNHGWVSNFIIRILKDMPITIFGTDKQVRDILYATDAARLFEKYFWKEKAGLYVVGGGPECAVSLRNVIKIVSEYSKKVPVIKMEDHRFGDLYFFVSSNEKIAKELEWKPSILPDAGIRLTVDWIKENLDLFEGFI